MENLTKEERKELRKREEMELANREKRKSFFKRISIFFGTILVLALSIFLLSKTGGQTQQVLSQSDVNLNLPAVSEKDFKRGNKDAKVVIVEYSDFQCPACAYYDPFVKQALSDFDGKITLVYRFFPLKQSHKNAMAASQTGYAAGQQKKFWEMHDLLFENQNKWSGLDDPTETFFSYAKQLNLDLNKFKMDYEAEDTKSFINEQQDKGITIGVNSTPTFFINGKQLFQNPRTYEEFKEIIEKEIK